MNTVVAVIVVCGNIFTMSIFFVSVKSRLASLGLRMVWWLICAIGDFGCRRLYTCSFQSISCCILIYQLVLCFVCVVIM